MTGDSQPGVGRDPREFPEREPAEPETLPLRLFHMALIAVMLSFASTVLTGTTIIQFVLMLVSKGTPNERLADFGEGLGIWIAKAARYQVAASRVKPWPWSDID